jgi:hypothetical protein
MAISTGGIYGAATLGTVGLLGGLAYRLNRTSKHLEDQGKLKEGKHFVRAGLTGYNYVGNPKGMKILNEQLMDDNKTFKPVSYVPTAVGLYGGLAAGYLLGSKYL